MVGGDTSVTSWIRSFQTEDTGSCVVKVVCSEVNRFLELTVLYKYQLYEGSIDKEYVKRQSVLLKLSDSAYFDQCLHALKSQSNEENSFVYSMQENNFAWKKTFKNKSAKLKHGSVCLSLIGNYPEKLEDLFNWMLSETEQRDRIINDLHTRNQQLLSGNELLRQQLNSLTAVKCKAEKSLFDAVLKLLNEKKRHYSGKTETGISSDDELPAVNNESDASEVDNEMYNVQKSSRSEEHFEMKTESNMEIERNMYNDEGVSLSDATAKTEPASQDAAALYTVNKWVDDKMESKVNSSFSNEIGTHIDESSAVYNENTFVDEVDASSTLDASCSNHLPSINNQSEMINSSVANAFIVNEAASESSTKRLDDDVQSKRNSASEVCLSSIKKRRSQSPAVVVKSEDNSEPTTLENQSKAERIIDSMSFLDPTVPFRRK